MRQRWPMEKREYLRDCLKGRTRKEAYIEFCKRYPCSKESFYNARYKFIGSDGELVDIPWVEKGGKYEPIGTENKHKDGFWVVKTADNEWRYKDIVMYEKYHGVRLNSRVCVVHLNRDYDDFTKENLYLMTRGDMCILNRFYKFTSDDPDENLIKCKMAQTHHAITDAKKRANIDYFVYPSNRGREFTDPIKIEVTNDENHCN